MNFQKIAVPILGVVLVYAAWRGYGWPGVALVVGGIIMWMLLHFTRMMKVLQRAGSRPVGYCDSAVMLNAKLKPGVNLLHVLALTRAIGEQLSEKGIDPEIYKWTDGTQSSVTCEFKRGKLVKWTLYRPPSEQDTVAPISTISN
ncbi:glycerate kinase [Ramlibacter albus]|uniref:Glycerate kinase n=1 Tax=Ramlibacter albus TaxID=2079448 RepID=A0A923S123_9BURK|nr:glycerate kinase [Ramlibacter albus]MBC5763969.1 glycerate kinase [Ramlibacter albus]